MKIFLSSKIHKATVTQADLSYIGSITIDRDLMNLVGLNQYEKVLVVSNTSGSRLETYVIEGAPGSGIICMNGAASHLIKKGEEIIIMAFSIQDNDIIVPKQILVDKQNKFIRYI
ncbi:MAG: aspartate 1-decarboxylase [Candidatus Paceibacterota bacterium]